MFGRFRRRFYGGYRYGYGYGFNRRRRYYRRRYY